MVVIGLTGGIASGKSLVSDTLRKLGITVIDADRVAREVVEPGQPAWADVVRSFGDSILLPDGRLDRKKLGQIVFSQPERREELNRITHPRIIARMRELLRAEAERPGGQDGIVVLDVPLLFEAKMEGMADEVWVVYVRPGTQLQRLMQRDGMSAEEAGRRIAAQMPLARKAERADRVIDNEGTVEETQAAVEQMVRELRQRMVKAD